MIKIPFSRIGRSLQTKIFIAVSSVTFFTLLIVVLSWYSYDRNTLRESATKNAINTITNSNSNLEILLKDVEHCNNIISLNDVNVLQVLRHSYPAPSYEWFMDYEKTVGFLNSMVAYRTNTISGIGIFSIRGDSFTVGNINTVEDIFDQPWCKEILNAHGENVILSRSADPSNVNSNEIILSMGKAIMDSGQCLGVVVTDIKYDIVTQAFRESYQNINTLLVIAPGDDIIYQSSKDGISYSKTDKGYLNILKMIDAHRKNGPYRVNGKNYLLIPYFSGYTKWTTVAILSQDMLDSEIRHIQLVTFLFFIILLIVTVFISMLMSDQITRNLKVLNSNIQKVSDGDFTGLQPVRAADEIGQLARAFQDMAERINQMMKDIQSKEREAGFLEIKALQAQISPHFLYNTLNTINYLALMQKADNISEVTTSLIDLLRLATRYDNGFINIREEISHVRNYIAIQKYKYFHEFQVDYQIDENLYDCRTPHMILQPIVENALIHGIEPMNNQEGRICIRIYQVEQSVVMSVTDNGIGMNPEKIDGILTVNQNRDKLRFSGIGISNVHKRIRLNFGEEYGIRIYSQPGLYTTVEIHIPIIRGDRDSNDQGAVGG